MEEKESREKHDYGGERERERERERQTFGLGLEIGMKCIKEWIINEINQNISINGSLYFTV